MTVSRLPSRKIAASLRQQIEAGELKPGDKIPTLQALAAAHEVDYKTARKAVALLVEEGLVEVERGLGTYVRGNADVTKTP